MKDLIERQLIVMIEMRVYEDSNKSYVEGRIDNHDSIKRQERLLWL